MFKELLINWAMTSKTLVLRDWLKLQNVFSTGLSTVSVDIAEARPEGQIRCHVGH
jgi:hypothetical protein